MKINIHLLFFLFMNKKYFILSEAYQTLNIQSDESKSIISINNVMKFTETFVSSELLNSKVFTLIFNFYPIKRIILSNEFKININFTGQNYKPDFFIKFFKIKAFSARKSIFQNLIYKYNIINLQFYHSIFNYSSNCSDIEIDGIFKNTSSITFAFSVKYLPGVCPLFFKNLNLDNINFHGISRSFLILNELDFNNQTKIDSTCGILSFHLYKGKITKRMIIFKSIKLIKINGLLDKIEDNAFQAVNVKNIIFSIDNEVYFFSKGLKWASKLNSNLKINFSDKDNVKKNSGKVIFIDIQLPKLTSTDLNGFSNEDFCLFKDFPDERLIFFLIKKNFDEITCVDIWLMKKACIFYYLLNMNPRTILCENITVFKIKIEECNFTNMINKCSVASISKFQIWSKNLILYFGMELDYFFTILQYLLVLIAFCSNSLSLFILVKIKSKLDQLHNTIENFMIINCIFNIFYLVTRCVQLLTKCVYPNSIFCSDFHFSYTAQLITIIVVDIIGNLLKFISSLIQISISINRLTTLDLQLKIKIIAKLKSKLTKFNLIVFGLIYLGILISSQLMMASFSISFYSTDPLENYIEYPNKKFFFMNYLSPVQPLAAYHNQSLVVLFIFILNITINNIFTMVVFCLTEVLVLINARSNIEQKRLLMLNNDMKNFKKHLKTKKSLNVIIINLLFIIFFRILSVLTGIFIIYQKSSNYFEKLNICSIHHKICTIVEEFDHIFFLLTISVVIIFFYHVYRPFKLFTNALFKSKN